MINRRVGRTEAHARPATRSLPLPATAGRPAGGFETASRYAGNDGVAAIGADILDKAFCLIKRQLQAIMIESRVDRADPVEPLDPRELSARILECTAALDHVYAALGPDIARMRQTERELHCMRTA